MTTPERRAGACLCGAVRFEVDGAAAALYFCYCTRCRRATGSAHASNLFVPGGTLRWLAGDDLVRTFVLPETRHTKAFCSSCGGALPYVRPEAIVVPAGSLETPTEAATRARLFVGARPAWAEALDELPAFDGLAPRDRT
jgi:hypothetical protein